MRPVKVITLSATAIMLISVLGFYFFYGKVAVYQFARSNSIEMVYKRLTTRGLSEFTFKDLKAEWRKRGVGFFSTDSRIRMSQGDRSPADAVTDFTLNNVSFIRKGAKGGLSFNSIDDLINLPFSSILKYSVVSGKISQFPGGIKVKNFLASSDIVRFSFSGTITDDNIVDADITIYFDKSLTEQIPPDLANMALKDEDGGWKSITVKLEGDLEKPSIKVTGKLFRLNIGVKPDSQ